MTKFANRPQLEADKSYRETMDRLKPLAEKVQKSKQAVNELRGKLDAVSKAEAAGQSIKPGLVQSLSHKLAVATWQMEEDEFDYQVASTEISRVRDAFLAKHSPAVAASIWNPAMKKLAVAWVNYQRAFAEATELAQELSEAGFWIHPMMFPSRFPSPPHSGDPADPKSEAHAVAGELVREGYLPAGAVAGK